MKHYKTLIVDDNPAARQGVRALLGIQPGIEIVGEATNGLQAIGLVERHRPDIVLVDVRMPDLGDIETTYFIKQRWPHIRVIVLSMNASYRARALAVGADAFVSKADPPEQWLPVITGEPAG